MSEIIGVGRVVFNEGGFEEYRRLVEQELELVRDQPRPRVPYSPGGR